MAAGPSGALIIPDDETYLDSRHDGCDGRPDGLHIGRKGYPVPGERGGRGRCGHAPYAYLRGGADGGRERMDPDLGRGERRMRGQPRPVRAGGADGEPDLRAGHRLYQGPVRLQPQFRADEPEHRARHPVRDGRAHAAGVPAHHHRRVHGRVPFPSGARARHLRGDLPAQQRAGIWASVPGRDRGRHLPRQTEKMDLHHNCRAAVPEGYPRRRCLGGRGLLHAAGRPGPDPGLLPHPRRHQSDARRLRGDRVCAEQGEHHHPRLRRGRTR